uniref:Odorant receptor n=1 Tax=Yemma signatus TaxID=300820 RepID=A0A385H540_9HEMI|nr:odorant receptor [Yemma signatus]
MDTILKKGVKYTKEEEKELKNTFKTHKGWYLVLGSIMPAFKIHPVFNILFYSIHFYILLYNVYLTFIVEEEMAIASEALYFTLIICCALCFTSSTFKIAKYIRELVEKLTRGVYIYGDTIDPETSAMIKTITADMKKRKFRLMNSIEIVFNSFFFGCVVAFPVLAGKFSPKSDALREKFSNLTTYTLNDQAMVIGWFPYDTRDWPLWTLAFLSEYYMGLSILCILDGLDLSFIGFAEEMCNEIEIFNLTVRNVVKRARYLYTKKFGREVSSFEDEKFHACLKECLKDSVRHHCACIRYFRDLQNAYSAPVLVVILTGALMLCMSGVIFVSKKVNMGIKLEFFFYLVGEITHIFIYSYYGERVNELSSNSHEKPYEMGWEEMSKVLLPYILMIQSRTIEPLKLSAGGLIACSFDTFGNVVSSAYSYFNLLSAAADF